MTLLILGVSLARICVAQEERPQITPGERKAPRKKDAGPRAIGVIQLGANGKASIVPIAILINGKFWDASAYKADPVPMALDSGNVYEGERTGNSLGLFTVGSALHSNNTNAAIPWLGTGVWRPNGTEPIIKVEKAEGTPVGIGLDDAPPRLTRDTSAAKPSTPAAGSTPASGSTPSPSPSGSTSGSSSGSGNSGSKPASSSGDEPPRLSKGSSAPDTSPSQPPANSPSPTSSQPPAASTPPDSKPGDAKSNSTKASSVPASDSGASEANRPKLRRGKPAESFADEDVPGYSLPGVKPAKDSSGKLVEAAAASKTDIQLIPAISDATGPDPKSYVFEWIPGEEADRRKQMVDLAKDQIRAYVAAKSKNQIAAKPAHTVPAKRVAPPKLPDPILENMQMVAYDLWNSNQPVLILSAQAHMPAGAANAASSPTDADLTYSIVLIAYPDIYHNLHKIYSGITDKFHLDMTPRLELIDAVDADGDGRGELLFRETSDMSTGWVVYRASADKLWKLFDSLNPQ